MPRMLGVLVSGFVVLGLPSAAAASPLAMDKTGQVSQRGIVVQTDFKCRKVDGKLVCGSTKGNQQNGDDDDDERPKKSKDKVIPKTCGKKVNCEAGFVKLQKPNKYGACCEAREGLPPPKSAEPAKCKFPGEVGTPPNCSCPPGTEFMGYRGCLPVQKKAESYCRKIVPTQKTLFENTCRTSHSGAYTNCGIDSPTQYTCCCNWLE